MNTNKQNWEARHAAGLNTFDVVAQGQERTNAAILAKEKETFDAAEAKRAGKRLTGSEQLADNQKAAESVPAAAATPTVPTDDGGNEASAPI